MLVRKVVKNTQVNGMRIFITVKEKKITQMVLLMMENLSLAKNMVKEHTFGLMKQFM